MIPAKYLDKVLCCDALDLMADLPSGCIDMVLTDPPYGIDWQSPRPDEAFQKPKIANDGYAAFLRLLPKMLAGFSRVLAPGGVLCMFCGGGGPTPVLKDALNILPATLSLENILVWDKVLFGLGWRYRPRWEAIIVATKGEDRAHWYGKADAANVLVYPRETPQAGEHPTPKPRRLIERLVADNTTEGQAVLDPFCGSGPVPLVCAANNRRYLACDIEPRWASYAQAMVSAETCQHKLL